MPEVALQQYLQEINHLIAEGHLDEAVRHCRHVLKQFPRHVETYRLLGKALLEQGDMAGAADIFQRVLSADPEDFIANAGIAIVRKEENRLREAVWFMERAFEAEPYNTAIRESLQDLIGRRDGLPPEQLSLTRGALARLYVRGDLYAHAIGDLQELLAAEPDRVDLQVLLAEAYWRGGHRIEAAEQCGRILERLPYCVKANAILAEVWLETERVEEAQDYLRRVFELTLPTSASLKEDTVVSSLFSTPESPPLPERIMVERAAVESRVGMPGDAADWINDLDFGDDIVLDDEEPQWLGAMQDSDEPIDITEGVKDEPEVLPDLGSAGADIADEQGTSWFSRSSDQLPGIGKVREETDWEAWLEHERQPATPVESGSQANNLDVEEAGMGTMDEQDRNQDEYPEADEPQRADQESSGLEDDSLDWINELQEAAEPDSEDDYESFETLEGGDLPDWLREGVGMEVTPEDLDWLDDADQEPGDDDSHAASEGDELPDWLREELRSSGSTEALSPGDDLSWLDQIAAGEGAPLEEPPTLSWSDSGMEEVDLAGHDFDSESEQEEEFQEAPLQDEVSAASLDEEVIASAEFAQEELGAGDDVPEDLDEAMAWLEQLASQQGAPLEELPSLQSSETEDFAQSSADAPDELDEAMDWLDDLARTEGETEYQPLAFEAVEETGVQAGTDTDLWMDEAEDEEVPAFTWDEEDAAVELEHGIGRAELQFEGAEPDQRPSPEEEEQDALAWESAPESADEAPEDLDEAMVWLEKLAAQQGAPVDELPSLQEDEQTAFEEEPQADIVAEPPEMDEAMRWLEQLATEGTSADERASWEELGDSSGGEPLEDLEDIPDDPELALAWLEGLAASDEAQPESASLEVVEEQATPPVPLDVVVARAEAEAILLHEGAVPEDEARDAEMLEDIPEDPDEAMAWLEKLAARQGAPREELPSLAEEDAWEDGVSPIEEGMPKVEDEAATDFAMTEETEVVEEFIPELEEFGAAELTEEEEAPVGEDEYLETTQPTEELEVGADEELEEVLPDWLALDDEEDEGALEWEEEAFDATGWLEAEEAALETAPGEPELSVEPELIPEEAEHIPSVWEEERISFAEQGAEEEVESSQIEDEALPEMETHETIEPLAAEPALTGSDTAGLEVSELETAEADVDDGVAEPELEEMVAASTAEETPYGIDTARQALQAGNMDAALEAYRASLDQGADLSQLIAELEEANQQYESQPRLWQLLGDAYSKNGQLQKALDAYREALGML